MFDWSSIKNALNAVYTFRALLLAVTIIDLMQINELTIPVNSRRVTYEIGEDGRLVLLANEP